MAEIKTINFETDEILINLKLTKQEYLQLQSSTKNLIVLPTDSNVLSDTLTTGKLGNGNRIMVPGKLLKNEGMDELIKKVKSKIFNVNNEKYLLIKLDDADKHIPKFE